MKKNEPRNWAMPSNEALFRFLVVSNVFAREAQGATRAEAVVEVIALPHFDHQTGRVRCVKLRSAYRWLAAYEKVMGKANERAEQFDYGLEAKALAALEPATRKRTKSSIVLPENFLIYITDQKKQDIEASVPELIRRARVQGLVDKSTRICRQTVFRTLLRMGFSMCRRKKARDRDSRRYAFAHRMQCVLCDGKHFRAGVTRAKRVALFFLDDSSRYFLHVVVGTSENKLVFLRGLYGLTRKHGKADLYFLDRGPGFIAAETIVIVARISHLIHGTKAYPSGHGKIEKLNQTADNDELRGLDGNPEVDPDCTALEHRLLHYGQEVYNHRPHESLGGRTPYEVFHSDERALCFPENDEALREQFVVYLERKVTNDHIVPVDSKYYELPRGYAGQKVVLHRRMISDPCDPGVASDRVHLLHEGRLIEVKEVDLVANAHAKRACPGKDKSNDPQPIVRTASNMSYAKTFSPIVGPDGGYPKNGKES